LKFDCRTRLREEFRVFLVRGEYSGVGSASRQSSMNDEIGWSAIFSGRSEAITGSSLAEIAGSVYWRNKSAGPQTLTAVRVSTEIRIGIEALTNGNSS